MLNCFVTNAVSCDELNVIRKIVQIHLLMFGEKMLIFLDRRENKCIALTVTNCTCCAYKNVICQMVFWVITLTLIIITFIKYFLQKEHNVLSW